MEQEEKKSIFNQELIDELLTYYPNELHQLILIQIDVLNTIFDKHKLTYVENEGFRKSFDLFTEEILKGSFVGFKPKVEEDEGDTIK